MFFFFILLFSAILLSPFFFSFLIIRDSRRKKGQKSLNATIAAAIKSKTLTQNNLLTLGYGSALAGFITWYICEPGHLGVQAPLLGIIFSILMLASAKMYKKKVNPHTYVIFAAAVVILSFTTIRSSDSLVTVNMLFGYAALMIGFTSLSIKPFAEMNISDYLFAQISPMGSLFGLSGIVQSASKLFSRDKADPANSAEKRLKQKMRINKEVVIGAGIAAPLLVIFTALFASADSTFSSLIPSIDFSNWNFSISPQLTWGLLTTVVVGVFVASMVFYALILSDSAQASPAETKKRQQLPRTSALIVLVSTVALFVVFCATQLSIIFGTDVLSDSATLSENARRGFGQLVFASIIVFALLAGIEHYVPKKQADSRFKALSLGLVFLTFVVLASAFMRLLATEAEYGFTVVRFFGHTYMILLAIWLAFLAAKMTFNFSWSHFSQLVAISLFGCVLTLNLINPENFISQTNINRSDIRQVDARYLSLLSSDAWPAIEEGIENGVFSEDETKGLINRTCNKYRHRSEGHDWRSWNRSINHYNQSIEKYLITDRCPDSFFDYFR